MDCEEVRRATPAWLYDDRPDADRRQLEAHLEACAECRARAEQSREAMQLLDRWNPPAIAGESDLARLLAARLPRRAPGGWRPLAAGLAAAAVLFLILVFLTAEIRFGDGRFSLAIGRSAPELRELVPVETLRPFVRTEMRTTLDARIEELAAALDELLAEREHEGDARLAAVARTIQLQRSRDLVRIGRYLGDLERDVALVSERSREAMEASVSNTPPAEDRALSGPGPEEQEEIR